MDVVSQCRRLWNRAPPLGSYLPQDASGSEQQCDRCHVFRFMVFTTGVGLRFSLGSLPTQSGNFLEFFSLRVGEQAAGLSPLVDSELCSQSLGRLGLSPGRSIS